MMKGWLKPQGAPRGLLRYYILRLLSERPRHGYELIKTIELKTHGAWRPGPGSVYPILKELLADGYLREAKAYKTLGKTTYEITKKGSERIGEVMKIVADAGQRLQEIRPIFLELAEPNATMTFCLGAVKANVQMIRELIESKPPKINSKATVTILRDLRSTLRQELVWIEKERKRSARARG